MSGVRVDDMEEVDLRQVQALGEQLGYPSEFNELVRRFKALASSSHHHLFVARHQGQVVGWIHVDDPRLQGRVVPSASGLRKN